jgi:TatD DNase family protein
MWTDSHCHISYEGVGEQAIDQARAAGVTRLITVGTDEEHSRQALELARRHDGVWATAGVHPHDAWRGTAGVERLIEEAGKDPALVAVGECGLDYHYDHSPRPTQREAFAAQVRLATERGLALVVHSREAWEDTFAVLCSEGVPDRWVLHCFTGGPAEAERALELGAFVSFSGIVTFKNAEEVRQAASVCPLDRLLVETDSPFLAPTPHRGQPNRPAWVSLVGAAIATATGEQLEKVEQATWENAARLFGLQPESE